jgi:hypothetical protein
MNIPPNGNTYRKVLQPFANLSVTAKYTPEMRVYISAGGFWNYTSSGMSWIEYAGGNSPEITAPGSNAKWVIVALTSAGSIVLIDGEATASPVLPAIPRGRVPLAAIYVQSDTVKITNDIIFDIRPVGFDVIPKSHIDLENTSTTGCHPISAITGLQDTLDSFATTSAMESALAAKADNDGTIETTFTLNKDQTGSPSSNISVEVERGVLTNVKIRWNESSDNWEYTDDGATYVKFSDLFINNGTQDIKIKVYSQASEPSLDETGKACIWVDTNDLSRVYLVFRRGVDDQVKIELT